MLSEEQRWLPCRPIPSFTIFEDLEMTPLANRRRSIFYAAEKLRVWDFLYRKYQGVRASIGCDSPSRCMCRSDMRRH